MQLTPREKDKLLIAMAAEVARRRLARGVRLIHPEATALITDAVVQGARDGRTVATTCTPGPWHIGRMLHSIDGIAMNIGLAGKGNAS